MADSLADSTHDESLRRLAAIEAKLDRVLIGGPDQQGLIDRVARIEERHGALRSFVAWLLAGFLALLGLVLPGLFKHAG